MALTRKFLSALGIEPEKIDEIITAHTETVDGLKAERDKLKEQADKLPEVEKKLAEATEQLKAGNGFKEKYEAEKAAHEATKKGIADREAKEAKRNAVTEYFKGKNISGDNLKLALRGSAAEIDGIELEDGKIKDTKALDALIAGDFAGLVEKTSTSGATTANPPTGYGGGTTAKSSGIGRQLEQEYVRNNYGVKES